MSSRTCICHSWFVAVVWVCALAWCMCVCLRASACWLVRAHWPAAEHPHDAAACRSRVSQLHDRQPVFAHPPSLGCSQGLKGRSVLCCRAVRVAVFCWDWGVQPLELRDLSRCCASPVCVCVALRRCPAPRAAAGAGAGPKAARTKCPAQVRAWGAPRVHGTGQVLVYASARGRAYGACDARAYGVHAWAVLCVLSCVCCACRRHERARVCVCMCEHVCKFMCVGARTVTQPLTTSPTPRCAYLHRRRETWAHAAARQRNRACWVEKGWSRQRTRRRRRGGDPGRERTSGR